MRNYALLIALIFSASLSFAQFIQRKEALADLKEFKTSLEKQSSYFQLSDFDFESRYKQIERKIVKQDSIPIYYLAYELEKIIAETIDRHANIRMDDLEEEDFELFSLHFPFSLAYLDGKVVALKESKTSKGYEYYLDQYHFLKSINGKSIDDFLERYAYRRKHSPDQARLTDGLRDLRDIGELCFKQGELDIKKVNIVLTDGKRDKNLTLPLSNKKNRWWDVGSLRYSDAWMSFIRGRDYDFDKLDRWLTDSIGYLALPAMISYEEYSTFEPYLKATMEKYRNAKALIFDIRGNSGGTREILSTLSGYIIQPMQSPWVANVAYVRSDQNLDEDISSMQRRFLYNYDSDFLSDVDRKSIDDFNSSYETEYKFDIKKFSSPFYMVLHGNSSPLTCPIYILVNEECFSAASVFASAFKGLPKVKLVGVNTNGSSGRSQNFHLVNSNIRVRLSTMLSFQRNGKTLDGNGTVPDIVLERSEAQVLGKKDTQLEQLIELIQKK
ncbi:MAG: S41 family peptidase [Aurantibacter sp.]